MELAIFLSAAEYLDPFQSLFKKTVKMLGVLGRYTPPSLCCSGSVKNEMVST